MHENTAEPPPTEPDTTGPDATGPDATGPVVADGTEREAAGPVTADEVVAVLTEATIEQGAVLTVNELAARVWRRRGGVGQITWPLTLLRAEAVNLDKPYVPPVKADIALRDLLDRMCHDGTLTMRLGHSAAALGPLAGGARPHASRRYFTLTALAGPHLERFQAHSAAEQGAVDVAAKLRATTVSGLITDARAQGVMVHLVCTPAQAAELVARAAAQMTQG